MQASIRLKELYKRILDAIALYDLEEKKSITYLYLENKFGKSRTDIHFKEIDINWSVELEQDLIRDLLRINQAEPIQYILGETIFCDLNLHVNKSVLIPRPETEELVMQLISKYKDTKHLKILDICSGSGCIAISMAKYISGSLVYAIDWSREAIELSKKNASMHDVDVSFLRLNVLETRIEFSEKFDLMVSNPPYVLDSEKKQMHSNVLEFEPAMALFVNDQEPLIFYQNILEIASKNLIHGGALYFEINETKSNEMIQLMHDYGYQSIELIHDFRTKPRFVGGIKS
jgi:release factor glutamine methyltransferase